MIILANYFGGYPQPQQYQQYQPQNNSVMVVTVQGESGASMYPVAAGNTVLLIDFNLKKFWLKATDINGLPAKFAAFDFTEVKPTVQSDTSNYVSRNEFEELKKSIEQLGALIGGKNNVSASPTIPKSTVPATV